MGGGEVHAGIALRAADSDRFAHQGQLRRGRPSRCANRIRRGGVLRKMGRRKRSSTGSTKPARRRHRGISRPPRTGRNEHGLRWTSTPTRPRSLAWTRSPQRAQDRQQLPPELLQVSSVSRIVGVDGVLRFHLSSTRVDIGPTRRPAEQAQAYQGPRYFVPRPPADHVHRHRDEQDDADTKPDHLYAAMMPRAAATARITPSPRSGLGDMTKATRSSRRKGARTA